MTKWISVDDKIPNYGDDSVPNEYEAVIIRYENFCDKCLHGSEKKTGVGYYSTDENLNNGGWLLEEPLPVDYLPHNQLIRVTHWMPLPKPPEDE